MRLFSHLHIDPVSYTHLEKEVNWQWIQPHQYTYFDVFSDLHGEYVDVYKRQSYS